jgi:mono/diheme cytochrome c family protein
VPLGRIGEGRTGSAVVLATWAGRRVAFVGDEDERAVRAVDLDARKELGVTRLPSRPGQLLVSADGRLLVTLRDESSLVVYRATDAPSLPLEPVARVATSVEPLALAETPDGSTALVVSGWGHALEAFREDTLDRTMSVSLSREPRAVVTSGDGATAFVTHAAASLVTSVDLRSPDAKLPASPKGSGITRELSREGKAIDLSIDSIPTLEKMRPKTSAFAMRAAVVKAADARNAFAAVRFEDGKRERIFVPHVIVQPGEGVSSGYGSRDETEGFTVDAIDPSRRALAFSPQPGDLSVTNCLLPSAAAVDAAGHELLVACRGVDVVRAFDVTSDHPTWSPRKGTWSVPPGASGIAIDEERREAVVWSSFDGVVSVLRLPPPSSKMDAPPGEPLRIPLLRSEPLPPDVALGRKLFYLASQTRIAADGRACASCHIDGRDDGLVWASPKGSRQTMMLAGRVDHPPPFGWLGEHASLPIHLAQTLKNLKGSGLDWVEIEALVAWLKRMPGPPAVSRQETAQEARGRQIFDGSVANCASCHVPRGGSLRDQMTHDVGSGAEFLTPSLRFASGSAPYFHDGRYASLEQMLQDPHGRMSDAHQLPREDLEALAAYVRTL